MPSDVREILPGLLHWTATHPKIGIDVSSYYLPQRAVLIDPLLPPGGIGELRALGAPQHALLTNRHHWRHCSELVGAFGCTVWCNEEGLHEFQAGEPVRGFRAGDRLPGDIESHPVGAICPDETALRIPVADGALAVADGVVRDDEGAMIFVPDELLGDEPEAVKRGLQDAYAKLLELSFDSLLFAHGLPWIGGAKQALRRFCVGRAS